MPSETSGALMGTKAFVSSLAPLASLLLSSANMVMYRENFRFLFDVIPKAAEEKVPGASLQWEEGATEDANAAESFIRSLSR
jgi:hypothetical protein